MNPRMHAEALAEVQRDIDRLEKQLEELRAVARWHSARVGKSLTLDKLRSRVAALPEESDRFKDATQAEAAEQVLRESDVPLKTGVIADKILAGGYPAEDRSVLRNSLFAVMCKDDERFEREGPGLWKLRSEKNGRK